MAEETFTHDVSQALREAAMGYPETSEGTSCVNRAFKVRKKNFLFVGEKADTCRVMLKLGPSVAEAEALAAADDRFKIGGTNWATLEFNADNAPELDLLTKWIDESFRMLAPKTVVSQLDA